MDQGAKSEAAMPKLIETILELRRTTSELAVSLGVPQASAEFGGVRERQDHGNAIVTILMEATLLVVETDEKLRMLLDTARNIRSAVSDGQLEDLKKALEELRMEGPKTGRG